MKSSAKFEMNSGWDEVFSPEKKPNKSMVEFLLTIWTKPQLMSIHIITN